MVHLLNRSAMENDIAGPGAGTVYLPSPSGLVSIDPQAGVSYDYRAAFDTLGAQQHSLGMNVSLVDSRSNQSRLMSIAPGRLTTADIRARTVTRHCIQ
jgi:hypothetical protein